MAQITLEEVKKSDQMLAVIFNKTGVLDKYRFTFHLGPHNFDLAMQAEGFDWFYRWLKN